MVNIGGIVASRNLGGNQFYNFSNLLFGSIGRKLGSCCGSARWVVVLSYIG